MTRRKACFIIDDSILAHHHGVRRLIFSVVHALQAEWAIDIFLTRNGEYFRLNFSDALARSNGFHGDSLFGTGRRSILGLLKSERRPPSPSMSEWQVDPLALNLEEKRYNCSVLGAPWVWKENMRLPDAEKHFCIAYDAIPNFYALERPNDAGLCAFALEHINAYVKYTTDYNGILAISEATASQCASVLMSDAYPIHVIPQIFPAGFDEICATQTGSSRKTMEIILAAPFDLRKGLHAMPALINASNAQSLMIFGGVRCEMVDVINFFEELEIEDVTWWSSISFEKQVELYKQSSLLLFPSLNEGLGLPLLEAYACGANAAVSDIRPLNELALQESILNSGGAKENGLKLASMLAAHSDPAKFKQFAQQRWASSHIFDLFSKIV